MVRTIQICLNRFGDPKKSIIKKLTAYLDRHFPAETRELNQLLLETLAHLQSQAFFKTFAGKIGEFSGGGPNASRMRLAAETAG